MKFRWTMKDLETKTDAEILRGLVQERQSELTNPYTPFAQRLAKIYDKLDKEIRATVYESIHPTIGTPEAGYHPGSLADPRD